MNTRAYLDALRRGWWLVLALAAGGGGGAYAAAAIETDEYRAKTSLVAAPAPGSRASAEELARTLAGLVETDVVLQNVIANLRLDASLNELRGQTDVDVAAGEIEVVVEDADRQLAVRIAQELGLVFVQLVRERFATTGTAAPSVTIFAPAEADTDPVEASPAASAAVGAGISAAGGVLAALLLYAGGRRLRRRDEVERALGAPVLGEVWRGQEVASAAGIERLAGELAPAPSRPPLHAVLVAPLDEASAEPAAANMLALALARGGASVALLDADLRRGVQADGPGLADVLAGGEELSLREGEVRFLPAGAAPPRPAHLLSSFGMRELLERLARDYDYVVLAGPPLASGDAGDLPRLVDAVVVSVRRGEADEAQTEAVRALLAAQGAFVAGVVLVE